VPQRRPGPTQRRGRVGRLARSHRPSGGDEGALAVLQIRPSAEQADTDQRGEGHQAKHEQRSSAANLSVIERVGSDERDRGGQAVRPGRSELGRWPRDRAVGRADRPIMHGPLERFEMRVDDAVLEGLRKVKRGG
jgi:hypothetical protein